MATTTGSKRILNISADAMAADSTLTVGGNNVATTGYVDSSVSNLVSSAPATLDTLNELAAALGDDPNFATTISNSIGTKLDASVNPIKSASASNDTITFTRADDTTFTVTTSDANTNYYLNGITRSGNVLTFSVAGTTNRTYTFGSAAWAATTAFDAAGEAQAVQDNLDGLAGSLGSLAYSSATIPGGSDLVKVYNNVNYIASGGTTGDYRDNYGVGVTVYEGYSGGTNRPHTYDSTVQFMSTSAQGFELSVDWVSNSTTPLKIRSLRDCCQGWSPWRDVAVAEDGLSGTFYFNDSIHVGDRITHAGDADTYIKFDTNRVRIVAGNITKFDSDTIYTGTVQSVTGTGTVSGLSLSDDGDPVDPTLTLSGTISISSANITDVAANADATPSWVPATNPNYLTSYTETSTLDAVADRGRTTNQQLVSTNPSGFRVDSGSYARIEIDSNNSWSYIRLQDNGVVAWDIATFNGGNLEWRPAGGEANKMQLDSSGNLTLNGALNISGGEVFRMYRSGGNAHQRADARLDGSDQARIHWYGKNDADATANFKHAWYDGANYINVTASNPGRVTFSGSAQEIYIGSNKVATETFASGEAQAVQDNLDGLAGSLGSLALEDSVTISEVTGLQTALDGKLSTSGGTLSGNLSLATGYTLSVDTAITNEVRIGNRVTLSESTDRADLLSVSSSTSGWGGLQITNTSGEGIWSFMVDGSAAGIYDDQNGDWAIYCVENSYVELRHNSSGKLATKSSGVTVTGRMDATSDVGVGAELNLPNVHSLSKIQLHGDGGNAHCIGTSAFNNTYGAVNWTNGTLGHIFYGATNSPIAILGEGGSTAGKNTSTFFGNVIPSQDRVHLLGLDTNRWQVVFCEILDSAGLHEKNLQNPEGEKSVGDYETGTVLVWKGGKNVPCTESADHMRMGIAVKGVSSPLVQGAEPVLCTGEVNEGDYLVTSSVEGHAAAISPQYMRQHNLFDCVLGKALESGNGDSHIIKTWVNI